MIPFEELAAALDRYAARTGTAATATPVPASPASDGDADAYTVETQMPPVGAHLEDTGPQPLSDDHSNEIDIGDVLSDEDSAN
jgi:hypothetical protein